MAAIELRRELDGWTGRCGDRQSERNVLKNCNHTKRQECKFIASMSAEYLSTLDNVQCKHH